MDTNSKFKSDPYNESNFLITENDILNIMKSLNIQDFTINNISFYQQAFVHKSYTKLKDYDEFNKPDNCIPLFDLSYETIEFLGDSLLGSTIAKYLYKRYVNYHNIDEGFLTKLKIRFVCGEQLAFLSQKLNFQKFMIISKHIQDNCNGRENMNILEDVFESFLGAIYLDTNNIDIVECFIIQCIESFIDFSDTILNDNNYKDQILRYFQHNFKVHPTYRTNRNDENNLFICKLFKEQEYIQSGKGSTKKKAEQDASKNALIFYHVL
jgi:ribonuclease-3